MASMSLPTPTLHTARLRLRPFNDTDANALFALHSSAYVLRYCCTRFRYRDGGRSAQRIEPLAPWDLYVTLP